ncbi:hypothetical protein SAMD00079811_35560 [Scytonema sp. HK-05]|uniref:hypothetical protein n=1 Tax=Scytonema sp. HK-05 TaxID=1137095 RepID=UPI000936B6AB|nr:hypothetical protein [Scytonema sp. HK-05]OKH60557.1 hypothetical protein NIES2130_02235 [Scytonema sp. HK-05]BAY45949.1 hypothetical protein SAMD00079811_35560 [Scytonema sp. HK-05]
MKLYYRDVSYEYDSTKVGSRKIGQAFKQVREFEPAYNLIYLVNLSKYENRSFNHSLRFQK